MQLYGENTIANHASACAYGFLLSIAPMLLLITYFIFSAFNPSPRVIAFIFEHVPIVGNLFDSHWLESDFFTSVTHGIPGLISILSIFWAGRILALSMQRALSGIFPAEKNRNPVSNTLVVLAVTASVFLLVLIYISCSPVALRFYSRYPLLADIGILQVFVKIAGSWVSSVILLMAVSYLTYSLIPVNRPKKLSALKGSVFFTVSYSCIAVLLDIILDTSKYSFIYGTFGSLIFLLVNVYFFFFLFFIGAQYAFVIDSFDALLFCRMRVSKNNDIFKKFKLPNFFYMLFNPYKCSLKKYIKEFKVNDVIISKGDSGNEIYYILEGEAEIFLSLEDTVPVGRLNTDSFFGEMGYILSESRTAYIRAKTDASVLILPPPLYDAILKIDSSLDRNIIAQMTRRLKTTTDKLAASVG